MRIHFSKAGFFKSAFFISFFFFLPLSAKALRIVSLKPNITQTLIDLDSQNEIVGLTKFCPKANNHAKVIADYIHIDIENLIRLNPDVIFLSRENTQKKQFETLMQNFENTPTQIYVLNFGNLSEFYDSYLKIGKAIQKEQQALEALKKLKDILKTIPQKFSSHSNKTFAVIVQRKPLIVASGKTYISSLFQKAGLKNIFSKNQIAYPVLNPETLLHKSPNLIFDMSHNAHQNPYFLNQKVTPIKIEDYLAHPKSHSALFKLFEGLATKNNKQTEKIDAP